MTSPLNKLLQRCKCGVFIHLNEHRVHHRSAETALEEANYRTLDPLEIAPEVRAQMLATNTIVELQFYPNKPFGSYTVWHYDVDMAIDIALNILERCN